MEVGGGGPVNQWVTSGRRGNNTTNVMDFKTLEEGKSPDNPLNGIFPVFPSPGAAFRTVQIDTDINWSSVRPCTRNTASGDGVVRSWRSSMELDLNAMPPRQKMSAAFQYSACAICYLFLECLFCHNSAIILQNPIQILCMTKLHLNAKK